MNEQGQVYIVDDDEAVRDSIGLLLETVDIPYQTFSDSQDFLQNYNESFHGALVLDIRMPGMSGLDLQAHLQELGIDLPIIFITGHGDIPMAVEAMRHGAIDFLRKPFRDQELLDRIEDALNVDARQQAVEAGREALEERIAQLTPRELEVFERVARGQANKVVAIELGISERTVEIHRSKVMRKTDCRTLADLVRLQLQLDT
ncbi:MAG: response regulator transcription factor [Pseudomonadota bacterium]